MNQLLILSLFFLIISGCSNIKPIARGGNTPDYVDLNLPEGEAPKEEETPTITIPEETIRLGERGGDIYSAPETDEEISPQVKKLRIGLSLGPGLYRSLNY